MIFKYLFLFKFLTNCFSSPITIIEILVSQFFMEWKHPEFFFLESSKLRYALFKEFSLISIEIVIYPSFDINFHGFLSTSVSRIFLWIRVNKIHLLHTFFYKKLSKMYICIFVFPFFSRP